MTCMWGLRASSCGLPEPWGHKQNLWRRTILLQLHLTLSKTLERKVQSRERGSNLCFDLGQVILPSFGVLAWEYYGGPREHNRIICQNNTANQENMVHIVHLHLCLYGHNKGLTWRHQSMLGWWRLVPTPGLRTLPFRCKCCHEHGHLFKECP